MADVESMAVVDGVDDLLEVVESLLRRESTSRNQVVEKFSSGNVFHDQVAVDPGKKKWGKRVSSGRKSEKGRSDERSTPPREGRGEKEGWVRTVLRSSPIHRRGSSRSGGR